MPAQEGFQISVRSSTRSTRYLGCRRGRYRNSTSTAVHRSAAAAAATYTSYTACPYSIKIAAHPSHTAAFALYVIKPLHNHAPFPEGFDADAARRTRAAKRRLVQRDDPRPTPTPTPSAAAPTSLASSLALHRHNHTGDQDNHDIQSLASTSLAAPSDVSMRTDTSAARHLLSLSLDLSTASQSCVPPAPPAPPAAQGDDTEIDTGTRHSVDGALQTVLLNPPFHSIMSKASTLNHAQATRALAWTQALAKVLQIHLGLLDPDAADTAIASLLSDAKPAPPAPPPQQQHHHHHPLES